MDRYVVILADEALGRRLPGFDGEWAEAEHSIHDRYYWCLYEVDDAGKPIRLVGQDGGEPEDQLLVRDWKWVVEEMNWVAEQRDQLRSLCAEVYQVAGVLGASVKVLDNLSAAAVGKELPHGTLLPYPFRDE